MAPWQTPDRDQLTAKYLIRSFALTQLAWPPWSNGVSCTHAKSQGLPGIAVWGCVWPAHPPIHLLSIFTAQHTPLARPRWPVSVLHLRLAQLQPQRQPQGRVGQRPQPLG